MKEPCRRTERHLREEVVNDMVVRHIVQEEAALPSQEWSVYSRSRTSLIVPLFRTVVW